MNSIVSQDLLAFIRKEAYDDKIIITDETRLVSDLRINGYDGVEFIVKYGQTFEVDVSQFPAAEYFENEGIDVIDFFANIFYFFQRVFTGKSRTYRLKELTIADLQKGIHEKKLS